MKRLGFWSVVALVAWCSGTAPSMAQSSPKPSAAADEENPVRTVLDPGVITTRQSITPAGVQTVFQSRVYGIAFGPSSDLVYALVGAPKAALVYKLDWRTNRVAEQVKAAVVPGMQSIAFDGAAGGPVIAGLSAAKNAGKTRQLVQVVGIADGAAHVLGNDLGMSAVGGLAVTSAKGGPRSVLVALTFNDELAIVDVATGSAMKVKTGVAPFGVTVNAAGTVAYVSNWGGRFPKSGDRTAATGGEPQADLVAVDARGIAASGTVARVDLKTNQVTRTIEVGLHPTSLVWDEAHDRLYVANSNSDTISVINTKTNSLLENIPIQPFERKVAGVAPEALAVSKDGQHLYAACAGLNAVAVVALRSGSSDRVEGLIPTAWYPDHIALSPDGNYLAVSTLLGVGSGWRRGQNEHKRYVHAYRGTLHVIPIPDPAQLAGYTAAVGENNRLGLRNGAKARPAVAARATTPLPVPMRAGDPSLIDHVVYIVKENRSYDQYFGDLGKGNGEPTLQQFGDDVVPNQRKLAREFVLLDNFYANGGNSADGHQWVTQASETDYTYWPGYGGRSYPKNGDDPLAYASSGFLWDNALLRNRTFEDYGEFVGNLPGMHRLKLLDDYKNGADFQGTFQTVAPIAPLNRYLVKDFPAYSLDVPDVVRARIFLRHIKQWETSGQMPNLVLVQLPSDHTSGTKPGFSTPKACFADNDLAVGQIVEGLSQSKFWKSTLILIVEDDAQDGLDHVDGHRTVALAISPYIRRGAIDSTFYSQVSFVKTIELILGLPTMSLFDLIANDMRNSFQMTPDLTPYTAEVPKQSIYEANPKLESLRGPARKAAEASMQMNFEVPDAAPTEEVNRIIWASARGWKEPYPAAKKGVFLPPGPQEDDAHEHGR
ncbi:MAG: alkaline phosphatase family protein [Bryobacteraceae bacterium]